MQKLKCSFPDAWIVIGETSFKLIEHARKEMEDVSRAVRIELSLVDRTI